MGDTAVRRFTVEQEVEIAESRSRYSETRRETSLGLEEILYSPIPVLDYGFVRVVDYMGNDNSVVRSARVSCGRGTKRVSEDVALIRYLMRHRHTTPFESCRIQLHVKLPVFVARQWIRHRMASVNEYSARYSILDREFYIPNPEDLAVQSSNNRQGRGEVMGLGEAEHVLTLLREDAGRNYDHYTEMLNEDAQGETIDPNRHGLARELARMNLTLNCYTQWYWAADLHNFMHFLSLRADSHAQYEIRVYAEAMLRILEVWVPATYSAFCDYRLGAVTLSSQMIEAVRGMISGEQIRREDTGMTQREWSELTAILGRS